MEEMQKVVHGQWLINSDGYYPYCSECHTEPFCGKMTKFCSECGARMDGNNGRDMKEMHPCGSGWVYCDGECTECKLKTVSPFKNKCPFCGKIVERRTETANGFCNCSAKYYPDVNMWYSRNLKEERSAID